MSLERHHSLLCSASDARSATSARGASDVTSDSYQVARAYMIRLEEGDLENPVMLAQLATAAKVPESEFKDRYRRAATRLFVPKSPDLRVMALPGGA